MDRRQFIGRGMSLSSLLFLSPSEIFGRPKRNSRFLSERAYRNATKSGEWELLDIEGFLPEQLNGTLLRVGPGIKENQGTKLRHYFDGDAFLNKITFENGSARLTAKFIETPQRKKEQKKGKMLFDEFGTEAPKRTRERKNSPNVNLIQFGDHQLALSEGGAPAIIDKETSDFKGFEYFKGTLPDDVGFSRPSKNRPENRYRLRFWDHSGNFKVPGRL